MACKYCSTDANLVKLWVRRGVYYHCPYELGLVRKYPSQRQKIKNIRQKYQNPIFSTGCVTLKPSGLELSIITEMYCVAKIQ